MALQTIKALCRGPWGDKPQTRSCWYEPFEDDDEIETAVSWVLNRPHTFLNTIGDVDLLPKVLDAAARFQPTDQAELDAKMAQIQMDPLFV